MCLRLFARCIPNYMCFAGGGINLRCEKKKQAQNVGTQCAVSNERMLSAGLDGVTGWAAVWLSCGSVDDVL